MSTHAKIAACFGFYDVWGHKKLPNGSVTNGIGYARAILHDSIIAEYSSREKAITLRTNGARTRTTLNWMSSALGGLFSTKVSPAFIWLSWPGKPKPDTDLGFMTWQDENELTITIRHAAIAADQTATLKPGDRQVFERWDRDKITLIYEG